MNDSYNTFLASKIALVEQHGLGDLDLKACDTLKPHQQDAVRWALQTGRALIAASFGLGKSRMQCQIATSIHEMTDKPFLLVCPLGVKHQFEQEDGPAMGMRWQYVRTDAELMASSTPFLITNYERVRDGAIDPRLHDLAAVSLDEGSVLRSLGSKTYQTFETVFANVPLRFVCTATPSPNSYRELIYYAQFLGVMDSGQALTRWFKRNPLKAGDLTIHPHHEKDFWMWVASWALFLYKPSDLGHDDTGYDLPPMQVHYHRLDVDHRRAWEQTDNRGQHKLLLDSAGSLSDAAKEKRISIGSRLEKAKALIDDAPNDHWLIWHHLEDERRAIEQAIPNATTVYGSQDLEKREQRIIDFSRGNLQILATKPEIAGSGCNFQRHCHKNIFLGIDYKFEDFIQSVHRTYRFQQEHEVEIHIIYTESEDSIIGAFKKKWDQHNTLVATMRGIIQAYGLSHAAMQRDLARRIGVERKEIRSERFISVHNDCVQELPLIADNSVGMILTSIPFGNQYEYSTQYEDFGHNEDDEAFLTQMDFLIPELLRVLEPGRIAAIHVKDRILYGHQTESGFLELNPFSDKVVERFRRHGFLFQSRRTIMTDVVRENNQTYRLGWSECCKDSTKMGCGSPEYLLTFRKPPTTATTAYADQPVSKDKAGYTRGQWQVDAAAFWKSNGARLYTPDELAEMLPTDIIDVWRNEQHAAGYDYDRHIELSHALEHRKKLPATFMLLPPKTTQHDGDLIWDDVAYIRTLNSDQARRNVEQHICPLPLDIVERALRLYSMDGDLVLDPFGGLHTVPYAAIKMNRRTYGIELHEPYWRDGVRYCQMAEREATTPTLFDLQEAA